MESAGKHQSKFLSISLSWWVQVWSLNNSNRICNSLLVSKCIPQCCIRPHRQWWIPHCNVLPFVSFYWGLLHFPSCRRGEVEQCSNGHRCLQFSSTRI